MVEWLEWHADRIYQAAEEHPAIAGSLFLAFALAAFIFAGSIEMGSM